MLHQWATLHHMSHDRLQADVVLMQLRRRELLLQISPLLRSYAAGRRQWHSPLHVSAADAGRPGFHAAATIRYQSPRPSSAHEAVCLGASSVRTGTMRLNWRQTNLPKTRSELQKCTLMNDLIMFLVYWAICKCHT